MRDEFNLDDEPPTPDVDADGALSRLAVVLGTGADLLAAQDSYNATALDDQAGLVAARAEVAAIALIAGRAVLRDLGVPKRTEDYRRVARRMAQLERVVAAGRNSPGLGAIRNLTTTRPRHGTDRWSEVAWLAVRWERAHQDIAPATLLTRDLRSVTSQLRTVSGYAWHLAECVESVAGDFESQVPFVLGRLKKALRAFDAGAARVSRSWQRRLSDVGGQSGTPGEVAFLDLKAAFEALLRPSGDLLVPQDLVPDGRRALEALDTLDELVDAAARVARFQQFAMNDLIYSGTFFVPRRDVASILPLSLRLVVRPGIGRRWMRSELPMHFTELTNTLAQSADQLAMAAGVARELSGTAHHRRPLGDTHARAAPPQLSKSTRFVAQSPRFSDQGQEPAGPDR
ncbi:hypothetical protein [Kribbella sp. CA-294648]|uniref:hypothetical protein n=1 Tax=Kribbella sp. CA-294648 TaxID=3239948 RepID=UPI003D8A173C